jgi:Leucine-rich repeat (LRR) protein
MWNMHVLHPASCLQVRFLPTGQDVLRCELVNRTWRSSTTCALLPPMCLTTEALSKTCPTCIGRNGPRLATLRAALAKANMCVTSVQYIEMDDNNRAALEMLAASASNISLLVVEFIGRDLQDSCLSRLASLTHLELHDSGVRNLPASLGALTGLQHLHINKFSSIDRLSHIDEASAEDVHWVQQLTQLTKLSVTHTNRLKGLGGSLPASLQELDLDHNPSLEAISVDMAVSTELRSFTISGKIEELPAY